jgi:hypothetical protein
MTWSVARKLTHGAVAAAAVVMLGAVSCPPPKPTQPAKPAPATLTLTFCFANSTPAAGFHLPSICASGNLTGGANGSGGKTSFQNACSSDQQVNAPAGNPVCGTTSVLALANGDWAVTVQGGGTCAGSVSPMGGSITFNADGSCTHFP